MSPAREASSPTDEEIIQQLDKAWAAAAQRKDLDALVDTYADDVVVMVPNTPTIVGKDGARELNRSMLGTPGYGVDWRATKVEVSVGRDMGYVVGTYDLVVNDSAGTPVPSTGKYLEVWKKQADGAWKVAAEIFTPD